MKNRVHHLFSSLPLRITEASTLLEKKKCDFVMFNAITAIGNRP